jgi:hypothetical protein
MFSFGIETIIGGLMFFLGVYAAISMQKAAQQFVTARYIADQSNITASSQRTKSRPLALIYFIIVVLILLFIPKNYAITVAWSFTAGILLTTLVFICKKVRTSFL